MDDDSREKESNIFVLFGAPGCGKSTELARLGTQAIYRRQDRTSLIIISMTNAAAHAIAAKDIPLPKHQIGTMHSMLYRQSGSPPLVYKFLHEWNAQRPELRLSIDPNFKTGSPEKDLPDLEQSKEETTADCLLAACDLARQRCILQEAWYPEEQEFFQMWTAFKREHDAVDFTDMIEGGLGLTDAPFGARLLIVDEVQDCSRLMWKVIHHLSPMFDQVLVAGDDDQCLGFDTLVTLADGTQRPIGEIVENREEHHVLTVDIVTGHLRVKKIIDWKKVLRGDRRLFDFNGLRLTEDHPLLVQSVKRGKVHRTYLTARVLTWQGALHKLHFLQLQENDDLEWKPIKNKQWNIALRQDEWVYCLDVEDDHNFFANNICVHNCIYQWSGADSDELVYMNPPPREFKVLPMSYRLPRAVHAYCERWVHQIERRQEKQYRPRTHDATLDGEAVEGCVWFREDLRLDALYPLEDIIDSALADNETVMLLTACNYQTVPVCAWLRAHGYPFRNQYRPSNGAWNPLQQRKGSVRSADRLLAFTAPGRLRGEGTLWTPTELKRWFPLLSTTGLLVRGAKGAVEELPETESEVPFDFFAGLFKNYESLEHFLRQQPETLFMAATEQGQRALAFPQHIYTRNPILLEQPPPVTIGTIHSAKGGEADICIVFPDIAPRSFDDWERNQQDAILRQFYVGISRAKETLILAAPSTQRYVPWVEID